MLLRVVDGGTTTIHNMIMKTIRMFMKTRRLNVITRRRQRHYDDTYGSQKVIIGMGHLNAKAGDN